MEGLTQIQKLKIQQARIKSARCNYSFRGLAKIENDLNEYAPFIFIGVTYHMISVGPYGLTFIGKTMKDDSYVPEYLLNPVDCL